MTKAIAEQINERNCRSRRFDGRWASLVIFAIVVSCATTLAFSCYLLSGSAVPPFRLTFLDESLDAFGCIVGFHQLVEI